MNVNSVLAPFKKIKITMQVSTKVFFFISHCCVKEVSNDTVILMKILCVYQNELYGRVRKAHKFTNKPIRLDSKIQCSKPMMYEHQLEVYQVIVAEI